jgi:hypothetical protein
MALGSNGGSSGSSQSSSRAGGNRSGSKKVPQNWLKVLYWGLVLTGIYFA